MKRLVVGLVVVVVLGAAATVAVLVLSSRSTAASRLDPSSISRAGIATAPPIRAFAGIAETGFRVAYAPTDDPAHARIRELFAGDRVLESIAGALDRVLAMPRTVDIQMVACGQPNAFYDGEHYRIIVCYELITYFLDTFRPHVAGDEALGVAAMGATF